MSEERTAASTRSMDSEETDSGLEELTKGLGEGEEVGENSEKETKRLDEVPVPPNVPQSGISILAHKIWIGNLDKRLSQ